MRVVGKPVIIRVAGRRHLLLSLIGSGFSGLRTLRVHVWLMFIGLSWLYLGVKV